MFDFAKLSVEAIGTFVFLCVVLQTLSDKSIGPQAVAITLLGAIYFGGSTSGAHFNPAITAAMFFENQIELDTAGYYIGAQLLGAFLAVKFYHLVLRNKGFF